MQPPSVPTIRPIRYEIGETVLERQTRIGPLATPPTLPSVPYAWVISCITTRSGGFSVVTYSMHSAETEFHALMWTDSWLALWKVLQLRHPSPFAGALV
eukprot:4523768-Pyramimonas_sp.AAC.1